MKTLNILFISMLIGSAMAQTQIPEGGFNNWTANSTNVYFEPSGGWWTSLNALATLGGPVTVYQIDDAHSGEFAAQLESKLWGNMLISGLLVSGGFILAEPYIQNGQPFSDSPSSFKGWYKYTPINNDSAGIAAILTSYNTNTNQQDTVATAIVAITESVQTYTEFEIDFDYNMTGTNPDTIIIVFTSSGDGGNFQGQVGSTLTIDDISLEYPSGVQESLLPEFTISVFPLPASEEVSFEFNTPQPEKLSCYAYSINGQLIETFNPAGNEYMIDISTWPEGKYILQVFKGNSLASTAKFIVAH